MSLRMIIGSLYRLVEQVENVEHLARVAPGVAEQRVGFLDFHCPVFQYLVFCQCALQQFGKVAVAKRLQHIDLCAGQQRTDYLERRIFGCRADEGHRAHFHCSKQ